MRRLFRDWDVLLVVFAAGLLTGLIVFMATDVHVQACHRVLSHSFTTRFTWVCSKP